MVVHLKGEFVKNEQITKKDGNKLNQAIVLCGDETVKISNCNFSGAKRLDPVELDVKIKSSDYGLYITPANVGN